MTGVCRCCGTASSARFLFSVVVCAAEESVQTLPKRGMLWIVAIFSLRTG